MFRKKPTAPTAPMNTSRKGFDLASWFVPTLGFLVFVYAMVFVALYTIRVGGPNVSLYIPPETTQARPNTSVDEVLRGISDAFDPNKK